MSCTECYVSSGISQTQIGSNGLISVAENGKMFAVINEETTQRIYAKGLATKPQKTGSGELYVSSSFIEAFKSLCDTLSKAFDDVRFQGSNKDHAGDIIDALNSVKNKLSETSLIANS